MISVAHHAHRDESYAFSGLRPLPYFFIGSRNRIFFEIEVVSDLAYMDNAVEIVAEIFDRVVGSRNVSELGVINATRCSHSSEFEIDSGANEWWGKEGKDSRERGRKRVL